MRLDLRKQIGDKDIKIETVLERALHLEAVRRIEEEEQTPKFAVIRRDETEDLVRAITKLVNQLSLDDKQRETVETNLGSALVPGDGGLTIEVIEDSNNILGSTIGGNFQRQDQITETNFSEEMNRQGGTIGCFLCGSSQQLKRSCPFKKKTTENCNVIRVCSTNTIKCLNAEIILHGNRDALD